MSTKNDVNVNDKPVEENKYLNLSNVGSVVTLSLLIAVIFAIVRFHFYYQVFLHIPIFQYIDASELVMITASYGLKWVIYLGTVSLCTFIARERQFSNFQKLSFQLLILAFGVLYLRLTYYNDPVMRQAFIWPAQFEWWYLIGFALFILFLIAYVHPDPAGPTFFRKNKFILPLVATVWYALFESWVSYKVLIESPHTNNIIVQTKSFGIIKTDSNIIDVGRTREYWFYYNRKTHMTKAIKTDDIATVDFDAICK